ncbi:MAG TPA: hypothetical protein PLX35_14825 [Cyclobacteriaceae bacterium]|nr:hypothetical protein [Cyclobacteriaceae bacterium]
MKVTLILMALTIWATQVLGQTKLSCLSANHKIRGYFYAGTAIHDSLALGGFWASPNALKALHDIDHQPGKLSIQVIKDDTSVFYTEDGRKWKGVSVLVINGSNSLIEFSAQDSRLDMVCEVFYEQRWQEIEYLPSSWCGNSYHTVYLGKNQYWRFVAPCYTGDTHVKLRFKLNVAKNQIAYSNEIEASFNPRSLTKQQGHKRKNLMDPYDN